MFKKSKSVYERITAFAVTAVMCFAMLPCVVFAASSDEIPADYRWDFVTDTENFTAKNISTFYVSDGALVLRASSSDPNIVSLTGLTIDPNWHRYVRFSMKNKSQSGRADVYLLADEGDSKWNYFEPYVTTATESDEFIEYEIDLYNAQSSFGTKFAYREKTNYKQFRLDPATWDSAMTGDIIIDYIVVSTKSKAQKNSLVSDVKIDGVSVPEFETDGEYFETSVYADVYNRLSETTASSIFSVDTEQNYKISYKTVTDRKIVDIKVDSPDGTYADNYRFVCKSVRRPADPTEFSIEKCELSGKKISISGQLSSGDSRGISIIAKELKMGNILYIGKLRSTDDGSFKKEFTIYDDEYSERLDDIEIILDADGAPEPEIIDGLVYVNDKMLGKSVKALKENATDGILEYMVSSTENIKVFKAAGVWCDLYSGISDEVVKERMNVSADKYLNALTAENVAEIANGAMLGVLSKTYSADKLEELVYKFDKNVKKLQINVASSMSEVTPMSFSDFDETARKDIIAKVKAQYENGFDDYAEFESAVRENMLLNVTKKTVYTSMKNFLLSNTDILNDELSELKNISDNDISDEAMKDVTKKAKEEGFSSVDSLVNYIGTAITDAKKPTTENNKPSKNNTNSGGGGNTFKVESPEEKEEKTNNNISSENTVLFNDMQGYDWAVSAVENLYKKGVVSGVGENTFEPSRDVTREEFVKLICEAFGFGKGDIAAGFIDVSPDAWYAPYISEAVRREIVTGISQNEFGTGMKITREDMAVILYRAVKNVYAFSGSIDSVNIFYDDSEIADYAKEAVNVLYQTGVINGNGYGGFEPKKSAGRAEAAVIINRCLEKLVD